MILSGTGHRKWGGGYGKTPEAVEVMRLTEAKLVELKPTKMLLGMALGWDMRCAWLCTRLGIPFEACLPFEGQEAKWTVESRARYQELLKQAARVNVLGTRPTSRWQASVRLQDRNVFMVIHSDALLAAWTGAEGGTANCVRYAERVGKRVIRVKVEGL